MKKILLFGVTGMLGSELFDNLSEKEYDVIGVPHDSIDICKTESVKGMIYTFKPDFVINCAAYTKVDECEENYKNAEKINGLAISNIANFCKDIDSTLVQISTDYVFDGNLELNCNYTEDMTANPINAYGKTKIIGEQCAMIAKKYYILRTSWLYGKGGNNFVDTMLKLSETKNEVDVISNQYGSPTSVASLVDIIEQFIELEPEYGIYHTVNSEYTSRVEFTKLIYKLTKKSVKVNPITPEEYMTKNSSKILAKRPINSKLSTEKLINVGIKPCDYKTALKKYLIDTNKMVEGE